MGWTGIDLDRSIAYYYSGDLLENGPLYIGAPIPDGVAFAKRLLREGIDLRIFTARVAEPDQELLAKIREAIEQWCLEHIGRVLPITNVKDWHCDMIYDDKATGMIPNTGRRCCMREVS